MKKKLLALSFLAASAVFGQVSFGISFGPPPPPRVVYARPAMPAYGYTWVDGFYYPTAGRYVWRDGYWARPPYAGGYWVAPRYSRGQYYAGYWGRPRYDRGRHRGWR